MQANKPNSPILFAAFAAVLLAGAERTARAQAPSAAVVVLPTDSFSEKAAAILNRIGRENIARSGKYQPADIRGFLEQDIEDPRTAHLKKAVELLKKGQEQYDNLDLDPAIETLTKSIKYFRKAAGRLGDGRYYKEALLYLGSCYILSGDTEQGREQFKLVAMFDKRSVLDKKIFPPSMIELFEKVKSEVATMPTGSMQIKSDPTGAEIFINGVYKGVTPLNVGKIPEGEHFIRIEKDGYVPWGKLGRFYATHEESLQAKLQPAPFLASFKKRTAVILKNDLDDDPKESGLVDLASWLRSEALVAGKATLRGDEVELELALVQVAPPKLLAHRQARLNFTSANFLVQADALFTSLYKKGVRIPGAIATAEATKTVTAVAAGRCNSDSDCAAGEVCDLASGRCIPYRPEGTVFYKTWWFWTLVGGGLAVAGGTAALVWYFTRPAVGSIEFSF